MQQHSALRPVSKNSRSSGGGSRDDMGEKLTGTKSMRNPTTTGHLHQPPRTCIVTAASSCPRPKHSQREAVNA